MKKILFLFLSFFISALALGQSTVARPTGATALYPQFYYVPGVADSLNTFGIYNPNAASQATAYPQLVTKTQLNSRLSGIALFSALFSILNYGGIGDGTTNNYTAYNTAYSNAGSSRQIFFSQNVNGTSNYNFTTAPTINNAFIGADLNTTITLPTTNGITFYNNIFTSPLKIVSVDRNNTGLLPRNDIPDWVFKAADNIYEKDNIQQPIALNATTFTKRQYNTASSGFITGLSTLTSSSQVTWTNNTNSGALDIVGNAPIIGNMYTCASSPSSGNANSRFGVLADFGNNQYVYFSVDPADKWYIGTFNGTTWSESSGITLPTDAYGISTTANTLVSYRIISYNQVEFYINGVFITKYTATNNINYVGFGWYGTESTSGGPVYAYDFVTGFSQSAYSAQDIVIDVYGDSITFGEGSNLRWTDVLKQIIEGKRGIGNVTINNYAVSGNTAAQQLTALTTNGVSNKKAVLVMVGTNDIQAQTSISSFKTTITSIITTIKAGGAIPIIAIPPTFISQSLTGYGFATANYQLGGIYRSAILRACAEQGGCYIADVNAAIGMVTASNKQYRDNIHPQPAYMGAVIASEFAKALNTALQPSYISNVTNVTPLTLPTFQINTTLTNVNVSATLTAAQVQTGVITTSTTAVAFTMPTATALATQFGVTGSGATREFIIDNKNSTASGAITITLGTGITSGVTPGLNIAIGTCAIYKLYFSSATTCVMSRLL